MKQLGGEIQSNIEIQSNAPGWIGTEMSSSWEIMGHKTRLSLP